MSMNRVPNMEGIVRPFTNVPILPPLVGRPRIPGDQPGGPVFAEFGGAGGTTFTWTQDGTATVIDDNDKFKESDRKSTKVRVENPDDPDQFVEFCRADSITLKPKKDTKAPRTSSYDTSGGYHDLSGAGKSEQKKREYSFQYPDDTSCQSKNPDKGGDCD